MSFLRQDHFCLTVKLADNVNFICPDSTVEIVDVLRLARPARTRPLATDGLTFDRVPPE